MGGVAERDREKEKLREPGRKGKGRYNSGTRVFAHYQRVEPDKGTQGLERELGLPFCSSALSLFLGCPQCGVTKLVWEKILHDFH